ncbi:unnamed protein product [Eruca vesicaria subsp. sativa]|uniref:No apical meristem-associated C-terminal domain-containing protein n=1 Tax=Eruca vesicaria subsp. sativa TaxID=29727 RepID=A0ABC8KNA6_ERUVS|nr:unnamed protein product [Eruca vesicaria subsp. sativa]
MAEGNNSSADSMISSNEQILNFLKESASTRSKNYDLQQLRLQNQAKKLALKERERDDKILLTNLDSVDTDTREYLRLEKAKIIQKRTNQEQQQPSFDPNTYQPYFDYF